jgi:monofunctional biosynthetic peptidoglycan transglycosylase
VADKDTREDDGTHGDLPMLGEDVRSEGRPAEHTAEVAREPVTAPPVKSETALEPTSFEGRVSAGEPVSTGELPGADTSPVEKTSAVDVSDVVEPTEPPVSHFDADLADLLEREVSEADRSEDVAATADEVAEARDDAVEPVPAADDQPIAASLEPETPNQPEAPQEPEAVSERETIHEQRVDDERWRTAIADVLTETAEPAPDVSEPPVFVDEAVTRDPEPAVALQDAGDSKAEGSAQAEDASFTSAASDLFRPPEITEEPHLTTIGRRLDPSLRIPRPQVPDLPPRSDTNFAPAPSTTEVAPRARPWTRVRQWWDQASWPQRAGGIARYAAYAVGGYLALVMVLILLFRFVNPPGSMLMLTQFLTGTSINRTWVPLSSISQNLVRAVVVSEDGRFCEHSGIDTTAIREAIDRAARGTPRGASTISMQVTKNLFLWNAKSYVRKVIEIPLTLFMELVWPKSRILEVYLNIAEWGPGVFGAEAAAQHHFNKSAARLNARESALLASVLPNPIVRDASAPNRLTSAKARVVQSRVKAYGAVATCVVSRAAAAPADAATPGTVRQPARKDAPSKSAPAKQPQRKKAPDVPDDWNTNLNFGR